MEVIIVLSQLVIYTLLDNGHVMFDEHYSVNHRLSLKHISRFVLGSMSVTFNGYNYSSSVI